jgi:dynein heavy chain
MEEINQIEVIFESKNPPPMPFSHPTHAGVAIWTYSLIMRANRAKEALDGLYFIPDHALAKEADDRYHKFNKQLDDSIIERKFPDFQAKTANISTSERIDAALQNNLLIRQADRAERRSVDQKDERTRALLDKQKPDLLESNFDTELLKLVFEVQYWNKLQNLGMVTFPLPLTRLIGKKEQLRVLRENVMLIVRDYNGIMQIISQKEKELFADHLNGLDKHIEPGIRRFNWLTQADAFVQQCRSNCGEKFKQINDFQTRNTKVHDQFEIISSSILTKIKKGTLYDLAKFMSEQEQELKIKQETFKEHFEIIRQELFTIYHDLFLTC